MPASLPQGTLEGRTVAADTESIVRRKVRGEKTMTRSIRRSGEGMEPPVGLTTFWAKCRRGQSANAQVAAKALLKQLGLARSYMPTIRSGLIVDLHTCPRKMMFRYRLALKPIRWAAALATGKVYHLMKGKLYGGMPMAQVLGETSDLMDKLNERLCELVVKRTGLLPWGATIEDTLKSAFKDISVGRAMALWSWKRDPLDFKLWEPLGIELPVEVRYETISQKIRIRADALLRSRKTGEVWYSDHKTTSQDTMAFASTLRWDIQAQLYRVALASLCLEQDLGPLVGCVHDIINKPGIRQRVARQPETFEQYLERLGIYYSEKLADWNRTKPGNKGPIYLRSQVRFPRVLMTSELLLQLRGASQACRCCISLDRFERRSGSCFKWNSPCPYLPLCSSLVSQWEDIIRNRYEVVTRDDDDILSQEHEDLI